MSSDALISPGRRSLSIPAGLTGVIAIPICTIAAFVGLLLAGRTLNVISLAGVAFASAQLVVHAHIHVHLPDIAGAELAAFEINDYKAFEQVVVEHQIDEGVLARLPVALELNGEPVGETIFREQAEDGVATLARQIVKGPVRTKAPVGPHVLIFDDPLSLALRLGPGSGDCWAGHHRKGHRGQKSAGQSHTS